MAGLTPFGVAIRKLRLDKRMRLLDLAARLKKSAAFLSAIETGRKPIPDGFVLTVARAMDLSTEQLSDLRKAADRTRKSIAIEKLPEDQRELVAAFARRIDKVPAGMMAELKKIVLKSSDGEQPFHRKRRGIVVPPMSTESLRDFVTRCARFLSKRIGSSFPSWTSLNFGWASSSTASTSTFATRN